MSVKVVWYMVSNPSQQPPSPPHTVDKKITCILYTYNQMGVSVELKKMPLKGTVAWIGFFRSLRPI
jgi:hypothetical protein